MSVFVSTVGRIAERERRTILDITIWKELT